MEQAVPTDVSPALRGARSPPALATPPPARLRLPEAPAHRPAARAVPTPGVAPAGRLQEGRTAQEGEEQEGREVWTESLSPLGPQSEPGCVRQARVLSAVSG